MVIFIIRYDVFEKKKNEHDVNENNYFENNINYDMDEYYDEI
jgi:hypothetical protein